jgi:Cu-Zn family superoxide dismutase
VHTSKALLLAAVLVTVVPVACGPSTKEARPVASTTTTTQPPPLAEAAFAPPVDTGPQPAAVTYATDQVPSSTAKAAVRESAAGPATKVTLTVSGLLPNHMYGAHVHTKACGSKPADSGPHYQNEKDPVSPSVDPKYANPQNEVWLDFQTDAKGDATSEATVAFTFRAGEANAVVVHANHTATEAGKAGTAGDRLACISARFS